MSDQQHLENAVRKRPTAKKVGWGLFLGALLGAYWLSASHFCFWERRFLSDREYIEAAIDRVRPYIDSKAESVGDVYLELLRGNPKCCSVFRENDHVYLFFARLTNSAFVKVVLTFPLAARYQTSRTRVAWARVDVRTCGEAYKFELENYPGSQRIYPE
jgi:hypothetical protein